MEKIVIAQLSVSRTNASKFIALANIMVEKSRQEEGCLTYRLFNEVDKPSEFIIYEKYVNQKAVALHNASEHLKIFLKSVASLLIEKPKIDTY